MTAGGWPRRGEGQDARSNIELPASLPKEQMQNLKEARFMRAFSFIPHHFPASLKVG